MATPESDARRFRRHFQRWRAPALADHESQAIRRAQWRKWQRRKFMGLYESSMDHLPEILQQEVRIPM